MDIAEAEGLDLWEGMFERVTGKSGGGRALIGLPMHVLVSGLSPAIEPLLEKRLLRKDELLPGFKQGVDSSNEFAALC